MLPPSRRDRAWSGLGAATRRQREREPVDRGSVTGHAMSVTNDGIDSVFYCPVLRPVRDCSRGQLVSISYEVFVASAIGNPRHERARTTRVGTVVVETAKATVAQSMYATL